MKGGNSQARWIAYTQATSMTAVGRFFHRRLLADCTHRPSRLIVSNVYVLTRPLYVESRCDAVTVGLACLFPPLSSGGAQVV